MPRRGGSMSRSPPRASSQRTGAQSPRTSWTQRTPPPPRNVPPPPAVPANYKSPNLPQNQNSASNSGASGGGGGLMSGLINGMTWGMGSSLGHRAMDGVLGPRQIEMVHSDGTNGTGSYNHNADTASVPKPCQNETAWLTQCISKPDSDVDKCIFYMDLLKQCQDDMLRGQSQR